MELQGDNHLSSNDRRFWALQYHLMQKFNVCPVFKTHGPDVTRRLDHHITWFIPKTSNFNEIKNFIMDEFKNDIREGEWVDGKEGEPSYWWGFHVNVYPYTPSLHYTERAESEKMVRLIIKEINKQGLRGWVSSWNHTQIRKGMLFGALATFLAIALSQLL